MCTACNACGSIDKANVYGSGYFDDPLPNGGPLLVRGHLIYKRHYTMPYHCMVYGMLYILQPGWTNRVHSPSWWPWSWSHAQSPTSREEGQDKEAGGGAKEGAGSLRRQGWEDQALQEDRRGHTSTTITGWVCYVGWKRILANITACGHWQNFISQNFCSLLTIA